MANDAQNAINPYIDPYDDLYDMDDLSPYDVPLGLHEQIEDADPFTEEDEEMMIATYLDDPDQGKIMCHACPDLFWPSELVKMPNGESVCSDCATEIMAEEANRKSGRKGENKGSHRTAAHLQMH